MKKSMLRKILLCTLALLACYIVIIYGFSDIYNLDTSNQASINTTYGIITGDNIPLKNAPKDDADIISNFNYNDTVKIIGKANGYYIVQRDDDVLGAVVSSFTTLKSSLEEKTEAEKLLDLINQERKNNGILELQFTGPLMTIATNKVNDMVAQNYFASQSPTLGSPFDMMKNSEITYRTAGESIAGNIDADNAFAALMADENNKSNLLNRAFNYVGIGVQESNEYGKIFDLMFIGK